MIQKKEGGNVARFAKKSGLSQQQVDRLFKIDIRNGKFPKVTPHVRRSILDAYTDINPLWIESGYGDMLISKNVNPQDGYVKHLESNAEEIYNSENDYDSLVTKSGNRHSIVSPGNYRLSVKLVEPRAFAGYLSGWADPEFIEDLPEIEIFVKEMHHGTYRGFRVKGESMEGRTKRAIYDGDVVVGRSLDRQLWASRLHIRERLEWVIVHSGGVIVKHISKHDVESGVITCVSYNEDKIVYPDFELKLDEVFELYGVVKSLTDR